MATPSLTSGLEGSGDLGFFTTPEASLGSSFRSGPPAQSEAPKPLPNQSSPNEYSKVLEDVGAEYPALAPHTKNYMVYQALQPRDEKGNSLETYLPWEDWNPHPGKIVSELYQKFSDPQELKNAIAGDLIHYLGAKNPKTGEPVDQTYYDLKQAVKKARSPEQKAIDYKEYKNSVKNEGEKRSFNQWFDDSRGEAYVRGRLFPDHNDEWKQWYEENPKLAKAVDEVGRYLKTGKHAPNK